MEVEKDRTNRLAVGNSLKAEPVTFTHRRCLGEEK